MTGATVNLKGNVLTKAYTPANSSEDDGSFTIGGEGALELFGNSIEIDTSDSEGGAVTLEGTVEAADSNGTLTIKSGGGAVDIAGIIGGTNNEHLGGLTINAEAGAGTIAIEQIGDTSNLGGVVGDVLIGNADTSQVNFDGTIYKINGDATITGEGGASDGTIDFTGGGQQPLLPLMTPLSL